MWSPVCDYISLDPKEEVESKDNIQEKKDNDTKK